MSALIGAATGGLGLSQRSPSVEECTQIERGRGIATLIPAAIRRLGLLPGSSLLKQHPKA